MSSMKLWKPSFNYGATQSNFSKNEHQEHHNTSHVDHDWATKPSHDSSYYGQAQGTHMGQGSYGFEDDDELGLSWANRSTNHYAQAQSVLPAPSIHVQQAKHVMEKKESHVAQEWGSSGAKCSSPARTNSSVTMMANGWPNKPSQCSSPARVGEYGASMCQGREGNGYSNGGNGGWAGKPTNLSGPNQVNQSAQMMYGQSEQHGWAGSPAKYSSSVQADHSSVAMHEEEHMMGKMDHGWAGGSPTKVNASSIAMHNEGHMIGKVDHGWAGSPVKTNNSGAAMHKEEHIMGKMDHGWAASPTKANHSSYSIHEEDHMMGKMDHGWAGTPTKANHSSLSMHKEEHLTGQTNHGYLSPNNMNHPNHAMCKEQGHNGWAGNYGHSYGPGRINHSAHSSYNHHDCEDGDVNDIMDEILTKYPAHNVSGGYESYGPKPNPIMGLHSQASSYAKQKAWAGSAHHGSGAQFMGWKENKAAYSASSNVSKYGMSSGMSNGGLYIGNTGVGDHSDGECLI